MKRIDFLVRKLTIIPVILVITSCGGGSREDALPNDPTQWTNTNVTWDGAAWADYSAFIGTITPEIRANLMGIAAVGVTYGRQAGLMGQIGDSISESSAYFRNAVMNATQDNETGHDYAPVRSWLSYSGTQPADANSFYRDHGKGLDYGNKSGWTLSSAISAGHPAMCVNVGNGPVPGNFAWVLIMFGTNDIDSGSWNPTSWKASYKTFVQGFIDLGVVPILSTTPPEQTHVGNGKVETANRKVSEIAGELNVLLVDFYALILHYQPTNWNGTLISGDGTHPSSGGGGRDFSQDGLTTTDGYAARTKLSFDVAEVLRAQIFEPTPP